MTTKRQLLSLLTASTLAAFAHGCGGTEPPNTTDAEHDTTSGGEPEASCGGGACGAVDPAADEAAGQ